MQRTIMKVSPDDHESDIYIDTSLTDFQLGAIVFRFQTLPSNTILLNVLVHNIFAKQDHSTRDETRDSAYNKRHVVQIRF